MDQRNLFKELAEAFAKLHEMREAAPTEQLPEKETQLTREEFPQEGLASPLDSVSAISNYTVTPEPETQIESDQPELASEDDPETAEVVHVAADASEQITELSVAKQIADGTISSPQKFGGMTLVNMRVTGTGVAYRSAIDEYCFRDPALYMNQEFVDRCAGLPVLLDHTEGGFLADEEYKLRNVGSLFYTYLKPDSNEVWSVAKIYDEATVEMMAETQLSTSPAVVFTDSDENRMIEIGGTPILVEGKPTFLDHLAICAQGVWDKYAAPQGVSAFNDNQPIEDEPMTTEVKNDAQVEMLASIADALARLTARLDAVEEAKKEEDKKDAEEELEIEAKAKEIAEAFAAKIAALEAAMPKALSDEEYAAMADAQEKAAAALSMHGESAPRAMAGETVLQYRQRVAAKLKRYSEKFAAIEMSKLDSDMFAIAEEIIYADAVVAAKTAPVGVEAGLRTVVTTDSSGRRCNSFVGSPKAWMSAFSLEPQVVTAFNTQR